MAGPPPPPPPPVHPAAEAPPHPPAQPRSPSRPAPHAPRRGRGFAVAAAVLVGGLAAGAIAFAVTRAATHLDSSRLTPAPLPRATAPATSPLPITDVARTLLPEVVTVEAQRTNDEALGTGWLFDRDGDFITNAHVVQGELSLRLTDRRDHVHIGVVLGVDTQSDIALVHSSDGFSGTPLQVDRTSLNKVPLPVVALASSRATGHVDMTSDQVIALHQDVPLQNTDVQPGGGAPTVYHDMLDLVGSQVFQGNSGGPVINNRGAVVGIITLANPSGTEAYAIPISRVAAELDRFAHQRG